MRDEVATVVHLLTSRALMCRQNVRVLQVKRFTTINTLSLMNSIEKQQEAYV